MRLNVLDIILTPNSETEITLLTIVKGLTGWISTNYLEGQLGDFNIKSSILVARGPSTLGALDWGGASAQITTEVNVYHF